MKEIYMRIESLIWLLENVQKGDNTAYILQKKKSTVVTKYIKYAKEKGLILQYQDSKRKPYKLSKSGEQILKILK